MNLRYIETDEFQRDFKRLLKRYRTLYEDFDRMKRLAIELFHIRKINNDSCFQIPEFSDENVIFFKVKKFACRCLKGGSKSGLRVIYAYQEKPSIITFIEIYHKNEKENNDYDRLKHFIKTLKK